jgi:hypothetical protein
MKKIKFVGQSRACLTQISAKQNKKTNEIRERVEPLYSKLTKNLALKFSRIGEQQKWMVKKRN